MRKSTIEVDAAQFLAQAREAARLQVVALAVAERLGVEIVQDELLFDSVSQYERYLSEYDRATRGGGAS